MNEQLIGDLFAEATRRMTGSSSKEFSQKFAELIVRKCMSFQDEAGVYSKFDMADAIAQHFGVSTHPLRRVTA